MRHAFSVGLLLLIAASAPAQSATDKEYCTGTAGTADERIAACTRVITSGGLTTSDLAIMFYDRGAADYLAKECGLTRRSTGLLAGGA